MGAGPAPPGVRVWSGRGDEAPVRVDYGITALGRTLLPIQQAIKNWAETHRAGPSRPRRVRPGRRRLTAARRRGRGVAWATQSAGACCMRLAIAECWR
ncbi:winged helix-turn-helix transcriptional regulator [Micromonospora sp. M71_S20]|uniref:winged helix-turn-helix transcriptional regulator n=1 Tax=Micromonospora sp. M71_S20 TaxID=592872 RepID=UPI00351912D1